jgi:PBP1b-binding outer membrane lipoprotein LpoB
MSRLIVLAAAAAMLGACATTTPPQALAPAIDLQRVNQQRYDADLAACQQVAAAALGTRQPKSRNEAVKDGVINAAKAGAKTLAKTGVNLVAAAPALAGQLTGDASAQRGRTIVSNCLKGRGYKVLE